MSNYPIWWDTSVTIYNKYEDVQTGLIKWYRYTVDSCFWKYDYDKVILGSTILESNKIICRIPANAKFMEKYEWVKLPNDEMVNYFTLGPEDIIIKGVVDDDIDEYKSGYRSTDFLSKYKKLQGCMVVDEVKINVGPGRCNEHYYVKGV